LSAFRLLSMCQTTNLRCWSSKWQCRAATKNNLIRQHATWGLKRDKCSSNLKLDLLDNFGFVVKFIWQKLDFCLPNVVVTCFMLALLIWTWTLNITIRIDLNIAMIVLKAIQFYHGQSHIVVLATWDADELPQSFIDFETLLHFASWHWFDNFASLLERKLFDSVCFKFNRESHPCHSLHVWHDGHTFDTQLCPSASLLGVWKDSTTVL